MRKPKISKKGKAYMEANPHLFTGGDGGASRVFRGGAHSRDVDYKRSNRRADERKARRGEWED